MMAHSLIVSQAEKVESPGTTPSYYAWGVEQIAGDIKESAARVSEMAFDASENANIPTVSYEVCGVALADELSQAPDGHDLPQVLC